MILWSELSISRAPIGRTTSFFWPAFFTPAFYEYIINKVDSVSQIYLLRYRVKFINYVRLLNICIMVYHGTVKFINNILIVKICTTVKFNNSNTKWYRKLKSRKMKSERQRVSFDITHFSISEFEQCLFTSIQKHCSIPPYHISFLWSWVFSPVFWREKYRKDLQPFWRGDKEIRTVWKFISIATYGP